jgi:uncharacterized membrane protein
MMDASPRLESAVDATALAHLYRGEMNRMTVWRQRLDVTSNWAILLTFGLTTFTLGSREVPHYTLLLGLALIGMSLGIEARRYRHLYHSKYRLYLMEVGYFAEVLDPSTKGPTRAWSKLLAEDLRYARFGISWYAAVRVRLRRNYLMLFYFITAGWLVKLFIHPASPGSIAQFHARLAVGELIPSWFVGLSALAWVTVATILALTGPTAEQLESWEPLLARLETDRPKADSQQGRGP